MVKFGDIAVNSWKEHEKWFWKDKEYTCLQMLAAGKRFIIPRLTVETKLLCFVTTAGIREISCILTGLFTKLHEGTCCPL